MNPHLYKKPVTEKDRRLSSIKLNKLMVNSTFGSKEHLKSDKNMPKFDIEPKPVKRRESSQQQIHILNDLQNINQDDDKMVDITQNTIRTETQTNNCNVFV